MYECTLWLAALGESSKRLLFLHLLVNKNLQTASANTPIFPRAHTPKSSAPSDTGIKVCEMSLSRVARSDVKDWISSR